MHQKVDDSRPPYQLIIWQFDDLTVWLFDLTVLLFLYLITLYHREYDSLKQANTDIRTVRWWYLIMVIIIVQPVLFIFIHSYPFYSKQSTFINSHPFSSLVPVKKDQVLLPQYNEGGVANLLSFSLAFHSTFINCHPFSQLN